MITIKKSKQTVSNCFENCVCFVPVTANSSIYSCNKNKRTIVMLTLSKNIHFEKKQTKKQAEQSMLLCISNYIYNPHEYKNKFIIHSSLILTAVS